MTDPKGNASTWYTTLSEADRQYVDAVRDWLAPVPWQFFITLEFPWNVTSETAVRRFGAYVNEIEKRLRQSICYIAGLEGRSKSGVAVPWHLHVLATSSIQIPGRLLQEIWWAKEGRGTRTELHPEGDSVVLMPFDDTLRGLEYCLKFANDCEGDWLHNWLEIFNPNIPNTAFHRVRRRRKRSALNFIPRQR